MRHNAKRFIELDKQILSNNEKADKYESGSNYDLIKCDLWRKKAQASQKKQDALELDRLDKDEIEDFYGCGQMFDWE